LHLDIIVHRFAVSDTIDLWALCGENGLGSSMDWWGYQKKYCKNTI